MSFTLDKLLNLTDTFPSIATANADVESLAPSYVQDVNGEYSPKFGRLITVDGKRMLHIGAYNGTSIDWMAIDATDESALLDTADSNAVTLAANLFGGSTGDVTFVIDPDSGLPVGDIVGNAPTATEFESGHSATNPDDTLRLVTVQQQAAALATVLAGRGDSQSAEYIVEEGVAPHHAGRYVVVRPASVSVVADGVNRQSIAYLTTFTGDGVSDLGNVVVLKNYTGHVDPQQRTGNDYWTGVAYDIANAPEGTVYVIQQQLATVGGQQQGLDWYFIDADGGWHTPERGHQWSAINNGNSIAHWSAIDNSNATFTGGEFTSTIQEIVAERNNLFTGDTVYVSDPATSRDNWQLYQAGPSELHEIRLDAGDWNFLSNIPTEILLGPDAIEVRTKVLGKTLVEQAALDLEASTREAADQTNAQAATDAQTAADAAADAAAQNATALGAHNTRIETIENRVWIVDGGTSHPANWSNPSTGLVGWVPAFPNQKFRQSRTNSGVYSPIEWLYSDARGYY